MCGTTSSMGSRTWSMSTSTGSGTRLTRALTGRSFTRFGGSAMFSATSKPLGLRTKLALWTSLVLAASLAAGFVWVHVGLRSVLEARVDAFMELKAAELAAVERDARAGGAAALEAEIRRE